MNDTMKLFESIQANLKEEANLKNFKSEDEIKSEFSGKYETFNDSQIDYKGDMTIEHCKQNTMLAYNQDKTQVPYLGYIILKDENGNLVGIKHYFNVQDGEVIEHTDVRSSSTYDKGTLLYYIGAPVVGK